jgi:hypothetical protein
MDGAVEEWIRAHVAPVHPIELAHDRPWAQVLRVPTADGDVWFKACAQVQAFEPRLSAQLSARWPDRVAEVLAYDEQRGWLLLADAGRPIGELGNPPETWRAALPLYAELQRGETAYVEEHLRCGVPDVRLAALPERYEELIRQPLPIGGDELTVFRGYTGRLAELCEDLAARGVPESIQHDDLHMANLFTDRGRPRVLDWGDSSISHPFASLVVTFRFLEERNRLAPDDPWFACLRDAYLEPWGAGHRDTFHLAMTVGAVAHAVASLRQRRALPMTASGIRRGLRRRAAPRGGHDAGGRALGAPHRRRGGGVAGCRRWTRWPATTAAR